MITPEFPSNESERLADLADYRILDTPYEKEFNDLAKLVANICSAPMSLITFVDSDRQWFKAKLGIAFRETERRFSFCAHAILQQDIFVIPDALKDERFFDNPLVAGEPEIRFYAGIPLLSHRGNRIGTLCVLDKVPREVGADEKFALSVISQQVTKLMELHRIYRHLENVSSVQNRLLNLIIKDFKSPMSSVGTLLNLLQGHVGDRDRLQPIIKNAAAEFQSRLDLLDSLVEWGSIYQDFCRSGYYDHRSASFFTDIFGFMAQQQFFLKYSFHVRLDSPSIHFAAGNGLQFVIRNVIHSLCECASDGNIIAYKFCEQGKRIVTNVKLVSTSILPEMAERIARINDLAIWPDKKDTPIEVPRLVLAKDMLKEINGSIQANFDCENTVVIEIAIKCSSYLTLA